MNHHPIRNNNIGNINNAQEGNNVNNIEHDGNCMQQAQIVIDQPESGSQVAEKDCETTSPEKQIE